MVYLSLGSNIGDRVRNIDEAVERISAMEGVEVISRGSLYETKPQGKTDQGWFVNTAIAVRTQATPVRLLEKVKKVEQAMGRTDGEKWGPRVIDIDIVFYGDMTCDSATLCLPHPYAASRRFVLAPLADIDPELEHPTHGKTVSQLLACLPDGEQEIRKI